MNIPQCIEIYPPSKPIKADIYVPGSKSITNRALMLAALSEGIVTIHGCLWSEDTQIMVKALQHLGYELEIYPENSDPCNRTIRVKGRGCNVPAGGSYSKPLELYVGNAGTAARFLAALIAMGTGWYQLYGTERMHQRPQSGLFSALRQLGCQIESINDHLPAKIKAIGQKPGRCKVDIRESSQFGSALLLAAVRAPWEIEFEESTHLQSGYLYMTKEMIKVFPLQGGKFYVEPDASSGSYFIGADWILSKKFNSYPNSITVVNWPTSGWQIDERFPLYIPPRGTISREKDLGDSIITSMILAPLTDQPVVFTDLRRLRLQECERVMAIKTELTRCGVRVEEKGDQLTIYPCERFKPAEIETYSDHRIAMAFSILALWFPQIKIKNPACVKKTFPSFYQKISLPPPDGLGAYVIDSQNGQTISPEALYFE